MEKKITKPTDEELAQVTGGGGAIYNRGNISNPDKIFGGNINNTKKADEIVNQAVMNIGNHEFNYCTDDND